VQICLHSCCVIVLDVFLLLLLFLCRIFVMLAQFFCHITVLWTPVSARILALVLQLYERKYILKLKVKRVIYIAPRRTGRLNRYDTIRDAILTCAQKLTYVSLIHRAYRRFTKPPRLFRRVSSRITYNVSAGDEKCWSTAVSEAIKGYNNLIGSTVQGRRHAMLMPVEITSTATHRLRGVYLLGCLQMDCNRFMTLNVTEGH